MSWCMCMYCMLAGDHGGQKMHQIPESWSYK